MKRNDKRAISAIVATVLIIGITVGVIAIVGNFIIGMVNENLQGGNACSNAALEVTLEPKYTCLGAKDANNYTLKVQVSQGDIDLKGLIVVPSSSGTDEDTFEIAADEMPGKGLKKVFEGSISYAAEEVSIIPIITIGESKQECSPSTPIPLKDC